MDVFVDVCVHVQTHTFLHCSLTRNFMRFRKPQAMALVWVSLGSFFTNCVAVLALALPFGDILTELVVGC